MQLDANFASKSPIVEPGMQLLSWHVYDCDCMTKVRSPAAKSFFHFPRRSLHTGASAGPFHCSPVIAPRAKIVEMIAIFDTDFVLANGEHGGSVGEGPISRGLAPGDNQREKSLC